MRSGTFAEPVSRSDAFARLAGATWDEIGDVLGLTGEQARSRFAESIPQTQHIAASATTNLSDEDVMKLAVAETRAVRRQNF